MQEENTTQKGNQEETEKKTEKKAEKKTKDKTKLTLGKSQIAMLSIGATVLVFILSFSCYGCSYQPITPPTVEEAKVTFENLYNSTWELDTTMGTPTLSEMYDMSITKIVIAKKRADREGASTTIHMPGSPVLQAEMTYQEGNGFILTAGSTTFPMKLHYSVSKDGKSETLTLIGNESNTHCYYLKK